MNNKSLPQLRSIIKVITCLGSMIVFLLTRTNVWAQGPPQTLKDEVEVFDPPGGSTKPVTGGYIRELSVPQNVESFRWERNDFKLHFTLSTDNKGKVVSVSRIEYNDAEKQNWKEPFVKSCKEALVGWKFVPTYDNRKVAVASGISLHFRFQKNQKGDCNIVVDSGVGSTFLTTNPGFIP